MNPLHLLALLVSLPLLLGGCGGKNEPVAETKPELRGVKAGDLEYREGIIYLNDTPYTGTSYLLYPNGQKKSETNWKDGKPDELQVRWHENGQKWAEVDVKDGELISEKYWNSKGEPVDSEEEAEEK